MPQGILARGGEASEAGVQAAVSDELGPGFEETDARILLVEGEPAARQLIAHLLSQFPISLSIVSAGSAAEAMDQLRAGLQDPGRMPGVVILDYDLPDLGAARLLTQLRRHEAFRTLPVVVLTRGRNLDDVRRAYDFGANAVVSRAQTPEAMNEIVKTLVTFWFETADRYLLD